MKDWVEVNKEVYFLFFRQIDENKKTDKNNLKNTAKLAIAKNKDDLQEAIKNINELQNEFEVYKIE